MQDQENKKTRLWSTYLLTMLGLLIILVVDSYMWGTQPVVQITGLVLAVLFCAAYFVWRGMTFRPYLIRTGIEWAYGLMLLALFGSWILSPDPRQGLAKIGWFLFYLILFYILLDVFLDGIHQGALLAALLTVSGLILFMAIFETYVMYQSWWGMAGAYKIMPPYRYRMISLLGHADALMGFENIFAPVALILFLRTRKTIHRFFLTLWLVLYCIAIPFTSSRAGLMGMITWAVVLILFWLWKFKPVIWWRSLISRKKRMWLAGGICALLLVSFSAFRAAESFSNHPIHGTNLFSSRSNIWGSAWQVWLSNIWFGAGPGRFFFEFLDVTKGTPPAFSFSHAHSLPIQVFAEFGVIGGLGLAALVVGNLIWFWRRYQQIGEKQKEIAAAAFAGVAGLAVHFLLDEFTGYSVLMVFLILQLSFFLSLSNKPFERWPQVSTNFLILPCMILMVGAGWTLWAYAPLNGIGDVIVEDPCAAAEMFSRSMERDPNHSFYATNSAFAWAACGTEKQDEKAFVNAHQAFEKSLQIEPGVSLFIGNQAVVDWQSIRYHDKAVPNMQYAIALSPREPSYVLNLGWMYEEKGLEKAAELAYIKSLDLRPEWASHPFWHQTDLRQRVLLKWEADFIECEDGGNSYWYQAQEAINAGEYQQAKLFLARAIWTGEPKIAVQVVEGLLAEAQGDRAGTIFAYQAAANHTQQRILHNQHRFMLFYTAWFNRRQGITDDFVPGYLQLDRDYGQFDALEKLHQMYVADAQCENAEKAWVQWQRALRGGALESLPPAPTCGE